MSVFLLAVLCSSTAHQLSDSTLNAVFSGLYLYCVPQRAARAVFVIILRMRPISDLFTLEFNIDLILKANVNHRPKINLIRALNMD